MAKRKVVTKKENSKEASQIENTIEFNDSGKADIESIEEVNEPVTLTVEDVIKKGVKEIDKLEKPNKQDLQNVFDQEVKDLLKEMGNIQSRYQQLGRTHKSRALRDFKRAIQCKYKEWK